MNRKTLMLIALLSLIAGGTLFIKYSQTTEKRNLSIQGSFTNQALTSLRDALTPAINTIIKEELTLAPDTDVNFFVPINSQRITVYYVEDVASNTGIDIVSNSIAMMIQENKQPFMIARASTSLKLDFFGDEFDELAMIIDDSAHELSDLNTAIKTMLHERNTEYMSANNQALYDVTKSERYGYHPHVGLGNIELSKIKEYIKDTSRENEIMERIKQRILDESVRLAQNAMPTPIVFQTITILDQQAHNIVNEYPL